MSIFAHKVWLFQCVVGCIVDVVIVVPVVVTSISATDSVSTLSFFVLSLTQINPIVRAEKNVIAHSLHKETRILFIFFISIIPFLIRVNFRYCF